MVNPKREQSLLDLALQHCGAMEAAVDIAQLNGLSLTDDVDTSRDIALPAVTNRAVVAHYAARGIRPATAVTMDEETGTKLGGIGYMAINVDFMIS